MNDHSWAEYAASYALGALDDDDRVSFETHLTSCLVCRAEVHAYRDVVGMMAYAAPRIIAPPDLRERVLTEARKLRPIASAPSAKPESSRRVPWLAAASIAAALALGALYYTERTERLAGTREIEAAQSELAVVRAGRDRADSLIAVLLAPEVQTAALASQGRPPSARLYHNTGRNVVVVVAFDLPPAAAGRTYQLWGLRGGTPTSLGTFNTNPGGRAVVTLPVPSGARFELSAVTDEPAGGSPQPTTTPFLVGAWSAAPQ
jgi:anti-sigma-K factor RskA